MRMSEQTSRHSAPWLSFLLLFLLFCHAQTASISVSAHTPSTSASGSAAANQRSTRSVELTTEEDKDGCSSDFVEKFFRLLSGPVGKEGEALVAAVLKILSENDRVNWPAMADSLPVSSTSSTSRGNLPAAAAKLRGMFLEGMRRIHGNEKRLAPKFNPTGWRRKRSVDTMPGSLDTTLSLLRGLLAKYDEADLLGEEFAPPKMPEVSDDVKLDPESPEWQENGKRSLISSRRVNRRRLSQRLPKRKPLEFNPTGW